jgi:hypothetical protein
MPPSKYRKKIKYKTVKKRRAATRMSVAAKKKKGGGKVRTFKSRPDPKRWELIDINKTKAPARNYGRKTAAYAKNPTNVAVYRSTNKNDAGWRWGTYQKKKSHQRGKK